MVDRIRKFQILNSQIFATLNKYLKAGGSDALPVEHVTCFDSPRHEALGRFQSSWNRCTHVDAALEWHGIAVCFNVDSIAYVLLFLFIVAAQIWTLCWMSWLVEMSEQGWHHFYCYFYRLFLVLFAIEYDDDHHDDRFIMWMSYLTDHSNPCDCIYKVLLFVICTWMHRKVVTAFERLVLRAVMRCRLELCLQFRIGWTSIEFAWMRTCQLHFGQGNLSVGIWKVV